MESHSGGRAPGFIQYVEVSHKEKNYVVGIVLFKDQDIYFTFDKEEFDKVKCRPWHFSSEKYISSAIMHDSKRKELYLHNLIMNRLEHPGKGAKETVDHINRNGLDNRKENLRILTQSQQNLNQTKKKRSMVFPTDFQLNPEDIPKHIWYVRANGLHGDRFAIEFKTENILWKSTSSKGVSIHAKLQQAKDKLQELYLSFPHLDPENTENNIKEKDLEDSYNEIIEKAKTQILA